MRLPICPTCGRTAHPTILVGSRFPMPLVPTYRGDFPDAPARLTREEAARDLCAWRVAQDGGAA